MCSASAGHPKKSLLSSFLLLLIGVVGGTMVANSVGMTTLAGGFLVINYYDAGRKDFKK